MESEKEDLLEKIQKLEKSVKIISEIEGQEQQEKELDKELKIQKIEAGKLRDEKTKLEKDQKNLISKVESIDIHTFQSFKEPMKNKLIPEGRLEGPTGGPIVVTIRHIYGIKDQ